MERFFKEAAELKRDTGLQIPKARIERARNKNGIARTNDFEGLRRRLEVSSYFYYSLFTENETVILL